MELEKNSEETPSSLYDVEGDIKLQIKCESMNLSVRQLVHSLPLVIVGHMVYDKKEWINAGALMAEHLTKKFVPRAFKWHEEINLPREDTKFNFTTHISGYSMHSFTESGPNLTGLSVGDWSEFPYNVGYKFKFDVSSAALENCKRLTSNNNNNNNNNNGATRSRDNRFKTYIEAIINSQDSTLPYNVRAAMDAVIFLVE